MKFTPFRVNQVLTANVVTPAFYENFLKVEYKHNKTYPQSQNKRGCRSVVCRGGEVGLGGEQDGEAGEGLRLGGPTSPPINDPQGGTDVGVAH